MKGMVSTFEMETLRMLKARKMLEQGVSIKYILAGDFFAVESQSRPGTYHTIYHVGNGLRCDCEDYKYNHINCKHIWCVVLLKEKEAKETKTINPIDKVECPECHSVEVLKNGLRHNKYGDIQRYLCPVCGKKFSINVGFEKMKHNPKAITTAMQLYFSGESLRNTQKSLRLLGTDVSHVTINKWIVKYIELMKAYCDNLKPNVGNTWRADEVWIKVKGDMKYLFALIDDETRYLIAQEVADSKEKHDARNLFAMGRELMGKKPEILITDGLLAYKDAFQKEYGSNTRDSKHISTIKLKGNMNNNKMERINGEIRDREKTMRGLKKKDTAILKGIQIYHNYIRPHEGLGGKTPAEACGIELKGDNKWVTLIQNAIVNQKTI
jgi:transposase-like protein